MIPDIGQVLLLGGLIISVVLGVFPLIGAANGNSQLMRVAGNAALAQFLLIGGALVMLTWAFIVLAVTGLVLEVVPQGRVAHWTHWSLADAHGRSPIDLLKIMMLP